TSGSPSNTEIKQSSDSRSLILRNRRATDPYGRWCGGGGVIPPRYPIRRSGGVCVLLVFSQRPFGFLFSV
ncbi:MAG: hypothetical protein AAGJ81_04560, partial [Verrucomicrobiota bacterium]